MEPSEVKSPLKSYSVCQQHYQLLLYVHQPVTAKFKSSEEKSQYKFEIQKIESSVLRENLRIYQKVLMCFQATMAKLDDLISPIGLIIFTCQWMLRSVKAFCFIFNKNKKVKDLPNLLEGYSLATLERKLKKAIETIALLSSENNI